MKKKQQNKKRNYRNWLDNDRVLRVFSVVVAICIWFVIAITVGDNIAKTIEEVPVVVNTQAKELKDNDLTVIETGIKKVDISVNGKRASVGGLGSADFEASVILTSVTKPGTYDLPMEIVKKSSFTDYEVESYNPKTVKVRVDRIMTTKLPVTVETPNLHAAEGYVMDTTSTAIPEEVEITGPESEVSLVKKAVVRIEEGGELQESKVFQGPIVLKDESGNRIVSNYIQMDVSQCDVRVTLLKKKTLPLKVEITNVPEGFPVNNFNFTYSTPEAEVAGPADVIDSMEAITIGEIRLSEVGVSSTMTFDVKLPNGFISIDNVSSVTVDLDTTDMVSKQFEVSSFKILDKPANFNVTVLTKNIPSVTIMGYENIMNELANTDIVAEILYGDIRTTTGEYQVPVRINIPDKGLVWATGEYNAVISVSKE